jgi:hypothetical protein
MSRGARKPKDMPESLWEHNGHIEGEYGILLSEVEPERKAHAEDKSEERGDRRNQADRLIGYALEMCKDFS